LLQFDSITTQDGICVLIPLKFCRGQCKSRRFATETRLVSDLKWHVLRHGAAFSTENRGKSAA
jgi:hypothetical protein